MAGKNRFADRVESVESIFDGSSAVTPETCNICEDEGYRILFEYSAPDQYEEVVGVTDEGYCRQWVECLSCGFRYSRYSRDSQILDSIYEIAYRGADNKWRSFSTEETFERIIALPDHESESKIRIDWIKANISECQNASLVAWQDKSFRMLDVGGATGVFAYLFQDENWISHIVDPAEDGQFMTSKYGVSYHKGKYQAGLFSHKFHLLSLIYVLEHLRDPATILEEVRKDMVDGGMIYIEVPDARAFEYLEKEDDIFNACHLWMYDPVSLASLLKRTGFKVLRLSRDRTVRGHLALNVLARVSS